MKRFMLLFVGLAAQPQATDDETKSYNQLWGTWIGGLAQRGILESGSPLEFAGKVVAKDSVSEFQPERVDIGGFLLIKTASMDEAVEIAGQAPHIALGGTTIVRACMQQ